MSVTVDRKVRDVSEQRTGGRGNGKETLRAREMALPGQDLQHEHETQCSNPKTQGKASWVWTLSIFPGVGDRDKDFPKQAEGPDQ